MIRLTILYPYREGAKFDLQYYCDVHIPLAKQKLGAALKSASVESGLNGGAPGQPPHYFAIGHLYFESVEAFNTAFPPHAPALGADVVNYTDVTPLVQLGEVALEM